MEKPPKKNTIFLSAILIIILGFTVYSNSFDNEFLWDDTILIIDNAHIKDTKHIPEIFTQDLGAGSGNQWNSYRPIQAITYMADYSLWKLDVKGYHLTNILLHIFVALSIYFLINMIFKDNLLSLLTGSFFVIHPIHTEVVTYISGRADSLALLFMLLCMISHIKSSSSNSTGKYILISLSYTLALLSRENSLILPVLLLVYHYSFKKKVRIKEFLTISSLSVIYAVLRLTVLKHLLINTHHITPLSQRLPGSFVALTNYIKLLFFPFPLHMEYGTTLFSLGDPKAILGVILLFTLLIYAFSQRENNKLVFFSISWFLVALLPVANIYPINAYMYEHWLYLPSIGFFLIVAKIISSLYRVKNSKIFAVIIIIISVTFYSYLTIRQNSYWRESSILYERTLKYAPDSSRVNFNLGISYLAINQKEKAIALFEKTIEVKPDHAKAHNILGRLYAENNRKEEAITSYKKAIAIEDNVEQTHYNLGKVYVSMNNNEAAIASYKNAIEIKPAYEDAHNNLGTVYADMDRYEEAIDSYKKAIEIKKDFAKAYYNLGNVYIDMNRKKDALTSYKKAIEIKPDYAIAYSNLSILYLERAQYKLAIENFKKAEKLGFVNPSLLEALKPYR